MSKYSVAIIGCGSIGACKDNIYDSPTTNAVLTHAHAFYAHPDTELVSVIDNNIDKATAAGRKWGCSAYENFQDFGINPIDVVVVATPTETHRNTLMRVLELQPRLVVAEKPFCNSLAEAQEVTAAYTAAGIPVLVNYTRRFDPVGMAVLDGLRTGAYGSIYHVRCLYGRGLRRDGCHGIDILNYVLGKVQGLSFNHDGIVDYLPNDPSYTLRLEYEHCDETYMIAADSRAWGAFELEFVCAEGIVAFYNWGKQVRIYRPEEESTYGQYKSLSRVGCRVEHIETALPKALLYMADACIRHLRDGEPLPCTPVDALRVWEVLVAVGDKR